MYYKEAVGAMIVFDVTRVSTFEAVAKWKVISFICFYFINVNAELLHRPILTQK